MPLSHDVYFTLIDASPEACDRLVQACRQHLTGHGGTLFFAAGQRGPEFQRPVNDCEHHVALHVVFADQAAHDAYQDHPRHLAFIAEQKENWAKVRVFDAWVGIGEHPTAR